ncbi:MULTISPECIES: PTS glucitol/sorbitol transporter subunit IIA [Mesobacillus]|uniref:PTS sorbitol transporter subunit IIA n=2 Tax=Mesobacillus TaxID=2675231 RepID=A0A0D6Z9P8_9BACI|nr:MULTISPECIES: PTS glucitol/sorbitol transporter subunit IIA [Mesobacillus]KIY22090.1 hypothetical protein UB32_10335 [Mesobacillus subterraneus]MDQ0415600.1 PTS system glucitol/sorbitol-specific IIA component [Mesobacillus stamsii]
MTIYDSVVTDIGKEVEAFLKEGMIIIFYESVPDELKNISITHKKQEWLSDVKVGHKFKLNSNVYSITFVGDKVNETLKELGHCTIKFGLEGPDLPGTLCVQEKEVPNIEVGSSIQFIQA